MIRIFSRKLSGSVDNAEMARFSLVAKHWWDAEGPYAVLQRMNKTRTLYIRQALSQFNPNATLALPLKGMNILDIGCGGGFLSQSLTRLGANVVGADSNLDHINIAKAHDGAEKIEFIHTTAEELAEKGLQFDSVCGLEIVEHVNDPAAFIQTCASLVKPKGLLFLSTINRTPISYLGTIVITERVFDWAPVGTHSYEKYVTPEELKKYTTDAGCKVLDTAGMLYNPLTRQWSLAGSGLLDLQMNYITTSQRA